MKKEEVLTEIMVKDTKVGIMKVGNINYISLTELLIIMVCGKNLIMKNLIPWNFTGLKLMNLVITVLL